MGADNPRWGVIGVIFTLVTAITGIVITIISISEPQTRLAGIVIFLISLVLLALTYWKLRAFKEITFQVISNTKVLSVIEGPEVQGRVKILLDDKPVRDVHVVVFRLWNSGSMPIERKDFDKNSPLTIDFDNETEVLEAEVLDATSSSLKKEAAASLKLEHSSVMTEPLLLNSKNSITLKFLVTKTNNAPEVNLDNTRLVGANIRNWENTIEAKIDKNLKSRRFYIGLLSGLLTALIPAFLGVITVLFISFIFLFLLNKVSPLTLIDKKNNTTQLGSIVWIIIMLIIFVTAFLIPEIIRRRKNNKNKDKA